MKLKTGNMKTGRDWRLRIARLRIVGLSVQVEQSKVLVICGRYALDEYIAERLKASAVALWATADRRGQARPLPQMRSMRLRSKGAADDRGASMIKGDILLQLGDEGGVVL